MCRDQQEICIYCGFQRHVHYQWCKPYIHDLRETVVQWPRVLPTPEDCPDYEVEIHRPLDILTCPARGCETKALLPGHLAQLETA
jgi:hypothetical protein